MLHQGSVGRVQNKIKNALIYFQVFFCFFLQFWQISVFIMMYALNMAYFHEEEMSVRLCVKLEMRLKKFKTSLEVCF